MPRARKVTVQFAPVDCKTSDDERSECLSAPVKEKKLKLIEPILSNLQEVLRELEDRRAKPKDLNDVRIEEIINKLKGLREKAELIFTTCLLDLDTLNMTLNEDFRPRNP